MTLDDELELERLRGEPQLSVGTGDIDAAEMQAIEESGQTREEVLAAHDALPENMDNLLPKTEEAVPYKFSPAAAMFNLPGTLGHAAWDTTYPIRHPMDFGSSMKSVAKGLYQKITPGIQADEATIDAMAEGLKDRYGSVENVLKTLETDPGGMLLDITGLASGGGAILSKLPGKAGQAAGKVADIANMADPLNVAANTVGGARQKRSADKRDPIDEMLEATKFGTTIDIKGGYGSRRALAETMLEYGYELNDKGIQKLIADMDKVGLKIEDILQSPAATKARIPRSAIEERYMPEFMRQKTKINENVNPSGNRAIIENEMRPFREAGEETGVPAPINAREMNELKKDFYEGSKYGKDESKLLDTQAEVNRMMGRGAKELVEEAVPAIQPYNEKWGRLAELKPNLMRSSGRVANRDQGGLMAPIRAGAMGIMAGNFDPLLAMPAAYLGYRSGQKTLPKNRSESAQKAWDLQHKNYGDIYRSSGALPNLLRGSRAYGSAYDESPEEYFNSLLSGEIFKD